MILLCIGMQRSASTWSFNVGRELLGELPGTTYGGFHSDLEDILEDVSLKVQHAVIKSHSTGDMAKQLLIAGKVWAVYTHRDIHDAIASQMQMFNVPFDEALGQIRASLLMIEDLIELPNFLPVEYQDITSQPNLTVRTIAAFLGLDVTDALVGKIVHDNSFEVMKRTADTLAADNLSSFGTHAYDTKTLLHPAHIRNGGTGYGHLHLDEQQGNTIAGMIETLPPNIRKLTNGRPR
jgi:hypothetical protein